MIRKKKIIIADDEREVLEIVARKLGEHGYLVSAFTSGAEALKECAVCKPDLVILDIAMPDMDGYSVAEALRADDKLKNVPILFITGKELEHQGIVKRIEELGAYDYLMKPCSFEDILIKVKSSIR